MKNQFVAMDELRWVLLPVVLIGALFVGVFSASTIEYNFSIWINYSAAFLIPTLGLYGVYIVAPKHKYRTAVATSVFGLALAVFVALPSFYPENHSNPYQWTYVPFLIVCATTLLHLLILRFTKIGKLLNI